MDVAAWLRGLGRGPSWALPGVFLRLATRKSAFRNRRAAQQLRQGAFLALRRQIAEADLPAQAARPPGEACTLR